MEKEIEVGKYYEFTRDNGSCLVIRGQLIEWTNKDNFCMFKIPNGIFGHEKMSEQEFKSMKEIKKEDAI